MRFGKGPSTSSGTGGSPAVRSVSLSAVSQPNPSNWPLLVAHGRRINPANQEIGVPGEETIHPTLFPSFSAKAGNRAPVRIMSQRGESPRQKEVWPNEAEGNCVAAMRGGEQPKAKDPSVTQVNLIRSVTLASLRFQGEAQMTPTTSREE